MRHPLLTLGALLGALLASDAARAQAAGPLTIERWICTDKAASAQTKPLEYTVQNGALIEQPLGVPRYRLLTDTVYGLVGVDFSTDLELGYVQPYVATVLIDRVSGDFTYMHGSSGGTPEARYGRCTMVSDKDTPTVSASAQRP